MCVRAYVLQGGDTCTCICRADSAVPQGGGGDTRIILNETLLLSSKSLSTISKRGCVWSTHPHNNGMVKSGVQVEVKGQGTFNVWHDDDSIFYSRLKKT